MTDAIQGYGLFGTMIVTANADGSVPLNAKVMAQFTHVEGNDPDTERAIWQNIVTILNQSVQMTNAKVSP